MKKNILLILLIILILAILAFMVNDLFFSHKTQDNPYELNTDSLNRYDSSLVCYKEISQIPVDMEEVNAISIDKNDNIIAAGSKLMVFDKNFKMINSSALTEAASCVCVNSNDEVFLGIQHHIEVRNFTGKLLRQWNIKNSESVLTSIAVDESNVYVADAGERRVHQFDFNGKFIKNMGEEDSINGVPAIIIRSPFFDVAIGRDQEIWIVNPGMYLVEAFDSKGKLKSSWGSSSDKIEGFCGCCNPTHITLLADGSFVTSEKAIPRVKIYSQTGEFKCIVAGPDQFNEATKGLDLATDSKNKVYVLDPARKQIRIFVKK
ncbi:MAG: hypothetical protein NTZ33_12815 [Bacteroidetes bacterium]|nr:hypothetical protein [Bacteroidota bacterium]